MALSNLLDGVEFSVEFNRERQRRSP
jgi:hypothetical protein